MQSQRDFLKKTFLTDAKVFDQERGYLSTPSFNLRISAAVLKSAAELIASEFHTQNIQIVHGVPHSGNYIATAVALELGGEVKIHASRKDHTVPATWKEVMRKEVRSFTSSFGGMDMYAGLNFSFVRKGDRVLVVDDVCARGETGSVIIEGLQERGVIVEGFAVLYDKIWQGGLEKISKLGIKTFSCVRVKSISKGDRIELV